MEALDDHPLATLFPLMEGKEFDALVADIKAHGLHDEIDVYQGKILDGRNRYRALIASEIEIEKRHFRTFVPEFYGDPLVYVLGKNLKRRHLNESQRADVAARLANLSHGGDRKTADQAANLPLDPAERPAITQAEAAEMLNVSERLVRAAKAVHDQGTPELCKSISRGHLAVSAAAQAAKLAPETQRVIAAKAEAGENNAVRTVIKQEARAVRETELGAKQQALPQKKYGVILADPEWKFDTWSENGLDRAADNHYPTSSVEVIASRDVQSIAAEDCVLFLWATAPMLPQALTVMGAWGFNYKSHCIWQKDRQGTGYWFRNAHELLLVGTRGKIPAPAMGTQYPSAMTCPAAAHSAKPEMFLGMIDSYFPTLPKIELNRRGPARPGWDAWGNEAEQQSPESESPTVDSVPLRVAAEPAPVTDHAGAGSSSMEDDPYEIPEFLRRVKA